MRIGFFTETYYPTVTGVATSIDSFGSQLVKRGNSVHVFCPSPDRAKHMGLTVHSCRSFTFPTYREFKLGLPCRMRVPGLDIVHTHGPFTMGWSGLRTANKQHIPKVSTFHTLLTEYLHYSPFHGRIAESALWRYCTMHYNRYDAVITPSLALKRVLQPKVTTPITVIPTGIDTSFFKPAAQAKARRILKLDAGRVYLYLGRLGKEKSVDVVIKAAPGFLGKDDRLIIVGRGPAAQELQELARKSKAADKISFRGFAPKEQLSLYYSASDAFITASKTETQGIVLGEAMACGCPVIAADILATPELVKGGKNGYLFKPDNAKDLAETVSSARLSGKMRLNALKSAREISAERCTAQLEKLYAKLCAC